MGKNDQQPERKHDAIISLTEFARLVNRVPATVYAWKRDGLLDAGLVYFPPPHEKLLGIRQSFVDSFGSTTGLTKDKK